MRALAAATVALALSMAACSSSDGAAASPSASPSEATSAAASASPTPPAPSVTPTPTGSTVTTPVVKDMGATMPLPQTAAPSGWTTTEFGGRFAISVPKGFKVVTDSKPPKDALGIVVQVTDKTSLRDIKDNSAKDGSFIEADGYVPVNETFDWPGSDGAAYVRQNGGDYLATAFVVNFGDQAVIVSATSTGPEASRYRQGTIDQILSTLRASR